MKRHKKTVNKRFKLTYPRKHIKTTANYELGIEDGII